MHEGEKLRTLSHLLLTPGHIVDFDRGGKSLGDDAIHISVHVPRQDSSDVDVGHFGQVTDFADHVALTGSPRNRTRALLPGRQFLVGEDRKDAILTKTKESQHNR